VRLTAHGCHLPAAARKGYQQFRSGLVIAPDAPLPACLHDKTRPLISRFQSKGTTMPSSDEVAELCVDIEELEPKIVPQSSSSFMDAPN
jgi:hypothetical protein